MALQQHVMSWFMHTLNEMPSIRQDYDHWLQDGSVLTRSKWYKYSGAKCRINSTRDLFCLPSDAHVHVQLGAYGTCLTWIAGKTIARFAVNSFSLEEYRWENAYFWNGGIAAHITDCSALYQKHTFSVLSQKTCKHTEETKFRYPYGK